MISNLTPAQTAGEPTTQAVSDIIDAVQPRHAQRLVARHPAERQMTAEEWEPLERILAVRLDNIGDVVLLGPALRAMRQRSPNASITLLASPAGAQAVPLLPEIDDVIVHSALWQDVSGERAGRRAAPGPRREETLVRQIKSREFDAAVIFTSFSQSPYPPAFVCHQADVPLRIGQSKEFGGAVLTHWSTPGSDGAHQAERNLDIVAGDLLMDDRLQLTLPTSAEAAADALLESLDIDSTFVLVHPGASCATRRYRRYREVIEGLGRRGLRVLVSGGATDVELASALVDGIPAAASIAGKTSVPELAAVTARAATVIANNSLALHLAEALDAPSVALYSGADELSQWAPRYSRSVVLGSFPACSPCHAFDCPEDMRCLDVAPKAIIDATLMLAEERSTRAHVDPVCSGASSTPLERVSMR